MDLATTALAVLGRAMSQIKFGERTLFSAFHPGASIDPELERWVKRAFAEFKQKPLFEPSRDLSPAVLEQIRKLERPDGAG